MNAALWGVSVALSWVWGLGLFFSVQISLQFGLAGLLAFAIPNALGLVLFGQLTHRMAQRAGDGREFERHFFRTSNSLRGVFLLYQFLAIALTFFAIFKYLFLPMGVSLMLGVMIALGAALLMGENFDITRIKWSHAAMAAGIVVAAACVAGGIGWHLSRQGVSAGLADGVFPARSWNFIGYLIPMAVGLLVGPWLDIQQWHRAIQIHREGSSIRLAYAAGAAVFFAVLLFHGIAAMVLAGTSPAWMLRPDSDGFLHAKDFISTYIYGRGDTNWLLKGSYLVFICLCILSTLDSGYVSLKWYLREITKNIEHVLVSMIPDGVLKAPHPLIFMAAAVAAVCVPTPVELEYFMAFYASFTIGYSTVLIFRTCYRPEFANFTQTTLFAVAAFSLGIFGIGYFNGHWWMMALGAVLPLAHGLAVISGRVVVDDLQKALPKAEDEPAERDSVSGKAAEAAFHALETAITRLNPELGEKLKTVVHGKLEPAAAQALATILSSIQTAPGQELAIAKPMDQSAEMEHASGHFEGKWFTHSFIATYQDTNSVGNVYFAQYLMWVGKVREMFLRAVLPTFDLKNTSYYILTRSIEHKFVTECREFDFVTVKIRVESYNRRFATLEHQVLNQASQILGKGKQVLLFVSSKDYSLVDIPKDVMVAFVPHT